MKICVSLFNMSDLKFITNDDNCDNKKDLEVVVSCHELSTEFSYDLKQLHEIAQQCASKNIPCFFQWDILMTENVFLKVIETLKNIKWQLFTAIRVKDPGALYYLRENHPSLPVHYIAESGNHNEVGIAAWLDRFSNISRVILSPELSYDVIKELRAKINDSIELEVLGMGMVLLFYTPRSLLDPVQNADKNIDKRHVWATGTSEESPHSGFPLLENPHGTFMYNTKDIFIFDEQEKVKDLASLNLIYRIGLIDCSVEHAFKMIYYKSSEDLKALKETCKRPFIKGFFRTNKTDVLFKKLKNSRIQNRDESFLGEVVEVKKKKHVSLFVKENRVINIGDKLLFSTPEGKEKTLTVKEMFNGAGETIKQGNGGEVVFFPPVGGVSVRTLVHRQT